MINSNEVRLGNLVRYQGKEYRIAGIAIDYPFLDTINFGVGVVEWKDLEPIELSGEWLVKVGFEKREGGVCNSWWNGINEVTHDWLVDIVEMKDNGEFFYRNGKHVINYLHQLQNLYFALTGKELTYQNEPE